MKTRYAPIENHSTENQYFKRKIVKNKLTIKKRITLIRWQINLKSIKKNVDLSPENSTTGKHLIWESISKLNTGKHDTVYIHVM